MLLSFRRRRLIVGLLWGTLSLPAVAGALPKDVPNDAWASTAVGNMIDKWPILGLSPEGTFDGNAEVSRYETAEVLWRICRLVEKQQAVDLTAKATGEPLSFADLEAQHEEAVGAVVNSYGLMQGFPGGLQSRFNGHRATTRYELAWMLHTLMTRAEAKQVAVTGKGPKLTYTDVPTGHWSGVILNDLTERYGLLIGFPDKTYRGDGALRRYELAIAMNACLTNLLEKQLPAAAPPPPKPKASEKPAPAPKEAPRIRLPGYESDYALHAGRDDYRDFAAGIGLDFGWWFDKVGPTRPGFGLNFDYSLLLNRDVAPFDQGGMANAELRWRLFGSDFADEPFLYLTAGYHLDVWHGAPATAVPVLFGHGIGTGAVGGLPLGPWDLWLVGRWTLTNYVFADESFAQRLSNSQQYSLALEKRWGTNSLRLGYYGTMYQTFPTTNSTTPFLPAGQQAAIISGHVAF